MKLVLGLNLGVGSIGWAAVLIDDNYIPVKLLGMGSRIVNLSHDESTGFTNGNGETLCQARTMSRSMRRRLSRGKQRRRFLSLLLESLGMSFGPELVSLPPVKLWQLRADATSRRLSLPEIGRVIYHINQRRGYRASKEDNTDTDSKKTDSDYLTGIARRAAEAARNGQTPGQYFAALLAGSVTTTGAGECCNYRVREKIFPRKAYEQELEAILEHQATYYPDILTPEIRRRFMYTVFHQRPLRSCKHLVALDEFTVRQYIRKSDGKTVDGGSHVIPVSSPLAQVCHLWEKVNNIELKNSRNKRRADCDNTDRRSAYIYPLSHEERRLIFDHLNTHEKLTSAELLKIVGLRKDDGFITGADMTKGIKGNSTRHALARALEGHPDTESLLRFDLEIEETVDAKTGEIKPRISSSYLRQPLYILWHTIYSESDRDILARVLERKFGITDSEIVNRLFNLDFRGKGHASKSAKTICRLLPYLIDGLHYSDACEAIGINHSDSITLEENAARVLADKIEPIMKGELRQPVIEKILNQMIQVVNGAMDEFGRFDEIRVELARELRQSRDERDKTRIRMSRLEKNNKKYADEIAGYGIRPTKNAIMKYRMWEESEKCCMYCGKPIGIKEFLQGLGAEKEHIIPRSLFFDDSFANKTCACRECNAAKGQMTAYDFMQSCGDKAFTDYLDRVDRLYKLGSNDKSEAGISKTKRDRLLTSRSEIPDDFLNRDLALTRYISRKAIEILHPVCRNVYATSGKITSFFRHVWGYDDILHDINLPAYSAAGQTEIIESAGRKPVERIRDWSKRLDHRHHAIDALVIALTRRKYISHLNRLNADDTDSAAGHDENLDRWASRMPHFSVADVRQSVESIAVSFKSGKKSATPGKRYLYKGNKRSDKPVQEGIMVPRGALTNGSVYGTIMTLERNIELEQLFTRIDDICDGKIRQLITNRLNCHNGNIEAAVASCKKQPLILPGKTDCPITAADCYKRQFVLRYRLSSIKYSRLDKIVDSHIRRLIKERFNEVGNDDKAFAKSLADRPIYSDKAHSHAIRHVRLITADVTADKSTPVKWDNLGNPIGFAKNGKNHHSAIYLTPDGSIKEIVVPFNAAVERRLAGIPVIIDTPDSVWEMLDGRDTMPDSRLLSLLPEPGSKMLLSLRINDMFVIGMDRADLLAAVNSCRQSEIIPYLYRVQSVSSRNYEFTKATFTLSDTTNQAKNGNYIRIQSWRRLYELDIVKVKVDHLGHISLLPDSFIPDITDSK